MPEKKDTPSQDQVQEPQQATQAPAQEEKVAEVRPKLDQTIPGGKYMVNGQLRNANGEPIDETGRVLKLQ